MSYMWEGGGGVKNHTQLKQSVCLVFPEAYSPESNHLKYALEIAFLMEYM